MLNIKPSFKCEEPVKVTDAQEETIECVLEDVFEERRAQLAKWGEQTHSPAAWYTVLGEEFGEIGHAINEGDLPNYREELIQTAAVCVAMVESIDRQSARGWL